MPGVIIITALDHVENKNKHDGLHGICKTSLPRVSESRQIQLWVALLHRMVVCGLSLQHWMVSSCHPHPLLVKVGALARIILLTTTHE